MNVGYITSDEIIASLSQEGVDVVDIKELIIEYIDEVLQELNLTYPNIVELQIDKHQSLIPDDVFSINKVYINDCKIIPLKYDSNLTTKLLKQVYVKNAYVIQGNIIYVSEYSANVVLEYNVNPYTNNNLIIPNNVNVKNAIKYYVKFKLLESGKYESQIKYSDLFALYEKERNKAKDRHSNANFEEWLDHLDIINPFTKDEYISDNN